MKKIITLALTAFVTMGLAAMRAEAATYTVNVVEDGYFMGSFNNWYMDSAYSKAYTYFGDHDSDPSTADVDLTIQGYFKYDIGALVASGVTSADVTNATMNFSLRKKGGMGPTPVPVGFAGSLQVDPYATAPNFDAYEGARGALAVGYTVSKSVTPTVDVTVGNATELVSIDITNMVKGWLDGSLANLGVEMIYPQLNTGNAYYWVSSEDDGTVFGAADPHLQVSAVPVPAAAWLLGSGLVGLLGFKRRSVV